MGSVKVLKEVNTSFFEIPTKSLKNKFYTLKYHMNVMKIPADKGELFLCNKTSEFDKYFVNSALEGNFVYLKDEIILKVYNNTLSLKEEKDIFEEVKKLKNLAVSIVVFPEKRLTVFGDFAKVPDSVADFLLKFEMTIKFVNLIGTYFINPVWVDSPRTCDTKIEHKFTFPLSEQQSQQKIDNIDKINKYLPSSASTYAKKFPIYLRTNKCAEHIERLIYVCPNCKNYFSLVSEFNCIKCTDCGTAFEISTDNAEISLTRAFSTLDEAKRFQFNVLLDTDFDDDQVIIKYDNIAFDTSKKKEKETFPNVSLIIYKNKLSYQMNDIITEIPFEMIFEFYLSKSNVLNAVVFDYESQNEFEISFKGMGRENFYIIIDLLKKFEQTSDKN